MALSIPKIVNRLWLGDKPMPKEYVAYGDSWRDHGYYVHDWFDADIPPVINRTVWEQIAQGVNVGGGNPEVGVAVQRADLLSYELVWRFGGMYANTDMECHAPLDDLLEGVTAFAVYEQDSWISNALFGGTRGHAFWGSVIERLPSRYLSMPGAEMNVQTGPHLVTEVAAMRSDLTVLPSSVAFPYLYGEMGKEGKPEMWGQPARCEHHWGHQHPELLA